MRFWTGSHAEHGFLTELSNGLTGDLDHYRRRVLALETRAEKAELSLEAVTSLEEILSRPVAEAYRQAAHLTEQALHQRLETSRLKRELSLQTEKVRYLEAINAELEARLEEYEAEAFRNQARTFYVSNSRTF
eukprot:scaffold181657_cov34-Prasinocladus_malaysianus.AAC.2